MAGGKRKFDMGVLGPEELRNQALHIFGDRRDCVNYHYDLEDFLSKGVCRYGEGWARQMSLSSQWDPEDQHRLDGGSHVKVLREVYEALDV